MVRHARISWDDFKPSPDLKHQLLMQPPLMRRDREQLRQLRNESQALKQRDVPYGAHPEDLPVEVEDSD